MNQHHRWFATAALATTVLSVSVLANPGNVQFPRDYRTWTHVKSMVIHDGHALYASFGGIHHLYANDKALDGYESDEFPDGAIIVFDLLEAVHANDATVEGDRKVLGVMQKDSRRFAATGGWGFEGFAGGNPDEPVVGADAASACFGCHEARRDADYVFSEYRD